MSSFIWVRDSRKSQHYINVDQIIRVTKNTDGDYIILLDGVRIDLVRDVASGYDTYDEVISKIRRTESFS